GTIASIKTLRRCPQFWNEAFLSQLEQSAQTKALYVIKSVAALDSFVRQHVK
ncbi:adenylate kinase, partial [Pseudoalteromonas phenolica]